MRNLAIIAVVLLLAACGGDEHQDLKAELKNLTKDLRGHVPPLPVVKPYEPVPYKAFDLPDPFGPAKIELATGGAAKQKSGANAPDANRPKEPLEAYPLESLKMVGYAVAKGRQLRVGARGQQRIPGQGGQLPWTEFRRHHGDNRQQN